MELADLIREIKEQKLDGVVIRQVDNTFLINLPITTKELLQFLHISPDPLKNLIKEGRAPDYVHIGGTRRFLMSGVYKFLEKLPKEGKLTRGSHGNHQGGRPRKY